METNGKNFEIKPKDDLVNLDELSKERLTPRILKALNRITEFRAELYLNDDYLKIKANKKGINVDTSLTLAGLVFFIVLTCSGVWKVLF